MSHARMVQEWLEGWNGRDLDRVMAHYADDAVFQSPTVLVRIPGSDGTIRGRAAIRELYEKSLAPFPTLRFELLEVIEREYGVMVIHRKHNVFATHPGLTIEIFETSNSLIHRNTVYWSTEEVAARFKAA
jgi:ketosteroid isomerase-like protein